MVYLSEILDFSPDEEGMIFTAAVLAMAAVTKPATEYSDWYVKEKTSNCRSTLIVPGLGIAALAMVVRGLEVFPSALPSTELFVTLHLANTALITSNTTRQRRSSGPNAGYLWHKTRGCWVLGRAVAMGVPKAILCLAAVQVLTTVFFAIRTRLGRQKKRLSEGGPWQGQGKDKKEE